MKRNLLCIAMAFILLMAAVLPAALPVKALQSNEVDAGTLAVGTITLSDSDSVRTVYYIYADEIKLTDSTRDSFAAQLAAAGYVLPEQLAGDISSQLDFFIVSDLDFAEMSLSDIQSTSDIPYTVYENKGSLDACIGTAYPGYSFAENGIMPFIVMIFGFGVTYFFNHMDTKNEKKEAKTPNNTAAPAPVQS